MRKLSVPAGHAHAWFAELKLGGGARTGIFCSEESVLALSGRTMSIFSHSAADQVGIAISAGESLNLLQGNLLSPREQSPIRLTDLTAKPYKSKLPPAVTSVPTDHIRGYVHNKKVNHYLVGSSLGEGSFAKVKEAFHILVGEKVMLSVVGAWLDCFTMGGR